MADFSIKIDSKAVQKQLSDMSRQIPFALATAVNDLAFKVMRAENEGMVDLFASPRPFTQKATQVEKRASKTDLLAVVSLRPAQERYLLPYETGGEHAVIGNGGRLLVPVDGPVDRYGQIPKGMLAKLLARPDVFAGTVKGIAGIWQRSAKGSHSNGSRRGKAGPDRQANKNVGLKLLYVWKSNTDVTKRLGFVERARQVVAAEGPDAIAAAVQRAIRTAR